MSFVQELRNARTTTSANVLQFLLQYKQMDEVFYLFFEGYDDEAFYINYFQTMLPVGWSYRSYKCQNKDDVYRSYSNLDWSFYSKNRVLFFADKDLSDFIPEVYPIDVNIFVTEFYSIENYVTDRQILRRIIREFCNFTDDVRIEPLLDKFEDTQKRFYKKSLSFMAWILLMRQLGEKPNLQNIKMKNLFSLDSDLNISKRANFIATVKAETGVNVNYSRQQLSQTINTLKKSNNPKTFVRGKFDLWMFVKFINQIPEVLNQTQQAGEKKIVLKVNLGDETAMKVIAPRVPLPKLVKEFLEININAVMTA